MTLQQANQLIPIVFLALVLLIVAGAIDNRRRRAAKKASPGKTPSRLVTDMPFLAPLAGLLLASPVALFAPDHAVKVIFATLACGLMATGFGWGLVVALFGKRWGVGSGQRSMAILGCVVAVVCSIPYLIAALFLLY